MLFGLDNVGECSWQLRECDYTKDGIVYCGLCNTPKQFKGNFLGKEIKRNCLCQCAADKIKAEEERIKEKKRREVIESNKQKAFPISNELSLMRFETAENNQPNLIAKSKKYVENFSEFKKKGRGLIFYGGTGAGKTFLSACIANALLDKGYRVLMTNFARISNELLGTFDKSEYMDYLNSFSLLIIDDMAIERNTAYMNETVYSVIDMRYQAKRPLIITTNLDAKSLKEPDTLEKQRVYSRLVEMCIPIPAEGKDIRYEKAKLSYQEDLKLLG